jgi:hypothetical protein
METSVTQKTDAKQGDRRLWRKSAQTEVCATRASRDALGGARRRPVRANCLRLASSSQG